MKKVFYIILFCCVVILITQYMPSYKLQAQIKKEEVEVAVQKEKK